MYRQHRQHPHPHLQHHPYRRPTKDKPRSDPAAENPLTKYGLEGTEKVAIAGITAIHIYDFDNTLFITPSPNQELFTGPALEILQNPTLIHSGGWWQDPAFLKATGEGWDVEQKTAWQGWWNEDVVALVRDSMVDPNVLTILLTGRRQHFGPLISEMCRAKGLTFDALVMRSGSFSNTLAFKVAFMTELLEHYKLVTKITIYEDRKWHMREFQKFLKEYSQAMRNELDYNVILVAGLIKFLDPMVETTLVRQAVQAHNEAYELDLLARPHAHRLVFSDIHLFTGYIIKSTSRAALLNAFLAFVPNVNDGSVKFHANAIVIRRYTVSKKDAAVLKYGKHYKWRVTHFGELNDEQWAVKVEPIGFKSRAETPGVSIIAQRKRAIGSSAGQKVVEWMPLEKTLEIETQLGDWTVKKIVKRH